MLLIKTDQFSKFQTAIGVVDHAILEIEQHFHHSRTVIVDTMISLQGLEGEIVLAPEVHEFTLAKSMTLWAMLSVNRLVTLSIF